MKDTREQSERLTQENSAAIESLAEREAAAVRMNERLAAAEEHKQRALETAQTMENQLVEMETQLKVFSSFALIYVAI